MPILKDRNRFTFYINHEINIFGETLFFYIVFMKRGKKKKTFKSIYD
jgi:hypothetical protein